MASGSIAMQHPFDAGPLPDGQWLHVTGNGPADRPDGFMRGRRPLLGVLVAVLLFLVAAGALFLVMAGGPGVPLTQPARASLTTKVPQPKALAPVDLSNMPLPDPLVFDPIDPDRARLINARIPFAESVGRAAKPFAFAGDTESRARAIDCLASAMWYEAGNDARGQRAVGQVVLNRVRHPAFPANVCGVVFQGSSRATGCQFTFTCDGALGRKPSDTAFAKARSQARAMLEGKVDPEVGLATHYHTNWVHPAWSAAMDKLAKVDTHLFFRWRGKWGRPSAMAQPYAGTEPVIARLAAVSPIHRSATSSELAATQASTLATTLTGPTPAGEDAASAAPQPVTLALAPPPPKRPGNFQLSVKPGSSAGTPALAALEMCDDKSFCKVIGRLPAAASPSFLYVRDRATGVERTYWDCGAFPRKDSSQCLSPGNRWLHFDGNLQSGEA